MGGEPTAYELGKIIGKYEEVTEATKGHLKSIDERLEKGDECMQNISQKIEEHIENPEIHFDKKKFKEGKLSYLAKKKLLTLLLTALATIISGFTAFIMIKLNGGT